MKDADPNRPQDQVVAMCYSAWRDAKKEKHKEAPFSGDATVDERLGWLEDDLRSLWMKIDAVTQRIDDIIAIGASKMNSRVVRLQAFQWKVGSLDLVNDGHGEISPCPCEGKPKFKSFKWVPELKMPDWATGRLYQFSTLESPITVDGQVFNDAQKNRCAASITGAPISIDHEKYDLVGQNVVLDADIENGRMEGLSYVEDPGLNELYDTGQIAGCSIEYWDRASKPNPDGTTAVAGTLCFGLTFVTKDHLSKGFVLGDPLSPVTAMTIQIGELIKERDQLKGAVEGLVVQVRTLELAVPIEKPILPDGAFAFVGDGERKLQIKDAEDKYDVNLLTVAVEELAKTPPMFPDAVLPGIREKLREGYKTLVIAAPDAIIERTVTLVDVLDPRIVKKLTHDMSKRARWRQRFQLFQEEEK